MDGSAGFAELVCRAQAGDAAALELLMAQFHALVQRVCLDLREVFDADISTSDLTQEVWLRIWIKIHQFQGGSNDELTLVRFRKWLRRVTQSVVFNRLAARRTQRRAPPGQMRRLEGVSPRERRLQSSESPGDQLAFGELAQALQAGLARISDPLGRRVVEMRFFESKSLPEIAAELDENLGRIRHRFDRAMAFLERELGGLS